MSLFVLAICLLGVLAVVLLALAGLSPSQRLTRVVNLCGPAVIVIACGLGLAGVFSGPWELNLRFSLSWGLPLGEFSLGLDPLTRLFLLPVFGLGAVCALSGSLSLRETKAEEHNLAAHWFFYVLLVAGMAVVLAARDAVLFLIAWEVMSLAPFFLIDFDDSDRKVRDAAWIYLVAAHLGAVLLITYFALLWQVGGSTDFAVLAAQEHSSYTTALFVLGLLGFGAKAGLAPMHVWMPEAYPAAPNHVAGLQSGAMINAGLYGILRGFDFLGQPTDAPLWWGWCILVAGLATALMGILKALAQSNLKRLLAYSSVENVGIMLVGIGAGVLGAAGGHPWIATLGFAGMLFHMLNHSAFKCLLFLCAGEVQQATGTVAMNRLGGLQRRMPLLGGLFLLGAASIACLPPFNGFAGEFVLALSLLDGASLPTVELQLGLLLALVILGLVSGLALAAYTKAYGITFLGNPRSDAALHARTPGRGTLWPLLFPAAACVGGGLLAGRCFELVAPTAQIAAHLPPLAELSGARAVAEVGHMLDIIACIGGAVILLTAGLLLLRARLLHGRVVAREETWGCGYAYGTARIQYTEASYSEPLGRLFGAIMGLKIMEKPGEGLFPGRASLTISAPDRVRTSLFTPLFEAVERLCNALKIVQHGKIYLYILYILVTLVALLIWGMHA
ncbi:MAG TPA: hypothetical protein H9784_04515 [Candidatus Desulfovibrio intestinavium]|uniref:NADH:quinone oxidoreductase/Mrp antiporter transmembrane domain-containing protein n=1 Tax=Candidatus Desulfovibrio intestinavium TaxID=2838534 RepID=A0A9D2KPJ0_9BACT|nr:hypothetical protein [Candidatus Desulfovibrio intestinavium]